MWTANRRSATLSWIRRFIWLTCAGFYLFHQWAEQFRHKLATRSPGRKIAAPTPIPFPKIAIWERIGHVSAAEFFVNTVKKFRELSINIINSRAARRNGHHYSLQLFQAFEEGLSGHLSYASIWSSSKAAALFWMNSNLSAGSRPISRSTISRAAWRSS